MKQFLRHENMFYCDENDFRRVEVLANNNAKSYSNSDWNNFHRGQNNFLQDV